MKQIAYPAALGGCVLGAGAQPLWAAEWSITPVYSSSVDYDNNRSLLVNGKGSSAAVLAVDLKFKRALEDLEFAIEPRYALRRYTDRTLGNGDDRTVNAEMKWLQERSTLDLTASYWDQSTLVTELLETGLVSGNTHRRLGQAGATWNWNQTERRTMLAQLSYMDVSYNGQNAQLLPGYRYPSGSLGERFFFSERGSFTVSAFGSRLQSDTRGNSSRELGLQAEVIYQFSERTNLDASVGESSRNLANQSTHGTDASVSLIHSFPLGNLSLLYTRSLVPYGFGYLVERQQVTATITHSLSPYLDATLSYVRVQNNETAVLLRLDRRNYDSASAGLNWHPAETWSVSAQAEWLRTQIPQVQGLTVINGPTVQAWRGAVTLTWAPRPRSRSW